MADYIQQQGGFLSEKDLADHTDTWVTPISVNYRGYEVYELPPNGQGTAALQMLNILEEYELSEMDHRGAEYIHLLTEAKKLAFEDRAKYYADPDFVDIPLDQLISDDYAATRRQLINPERAGQSYPAGS